MLILITLCFFSLFQGYQSGPSLFCLHYKEMTGINFEQLKGQWWEYQSFNVFKPIESDGYDCSVFNFYPANGKINMWQDYIRRTPGVDNKDHIRTGWTITESDPGSRKGIFKGVTATEDSYMKYDYTVVATDYTSWLLITICSDADQSRGAYVLTRSSYLNANKVKEIEENVQAAIKNTNHKTPIRGMFKTKNNIRCDPVVFPDSIAEEFKFN